MAVHRVRSSVGRLAVGVVIIVAIVGIIVRLRAPGPQRLQASERQEMIDFRAREDKTLRSYEWVDHNAGVVRIPIDQAIKLTLEQGLPSREGSK